VNSLLAEAAVDSCLRNVPFLKHLADAVPRVCHFSKSASVKFQSPLQQRYFQEMPRPMVILQQRAGHLSLALRLAPGRLGNERHVDHDRLPPCTALQPSLAKWQLLHTTLTRIAVECDRASPAFSMAIAEADFEK
jgi:hypothetical protein